MNSVGRSTATAPIGAPTCPAAALGEDRRGRGDHAGPDERRDQGAEGQQQVDGAAQLPGHEGLDEHADDGRGEDDEHRRELAVLDAAAP